MSYMKNFLMDVSYLYHKYHPYLNISECMDYVKNNHNLSYWMDYRITIDILKKHGFSIIIKKEDVIKPIEIYRGLLSYSSEMKEYLSSSRIVFYMKTFHEVEIWISENIVRDLVPDLMGFEL